MTKNKTAGADAAAIDAERRTPKTQIVRMPKTYAGPTPVSVLGRTLARGAKGEHDPKQPAKQCGFFSIEISDHDARQLKRAGLEVTANPRTKE